ncbi:RNA-binding S4 domain-containing protein [Candidatus Electronema sp. PJ]|uniref:RNA-binding S4 domain-containing protein n=1 Tax=Candidatus Electronema sp. PJ TaxID=3401572 RepID=UPI003AA85B10
MSSEFSAAVIRGGFIELCSLLKLENLAASGGEAKQMISAGMVRVNGELETRKRKKILVGDLVECNGRQVRAVAQESA